jgi:hypothetical protein
MQSVYASPGLDGKLPPNVELELTKSTILTANALVLAIVLDNATTELPEVLLPVVEPVPAVKFAKATVLPIEP